jgi:hypothetical protein
MLVVVVFHLVAPTTGFDGRCAVVPLGQARAPVVDPASTIPDWGLITASCLNDLLNIKRYPYI